jgi:hypothetical protein
MIAATAASSRASIGRTRKAGSLIGSQSGLVEARRELVRRQPGREQEALAHGHPEFEQEAPLRIRLHALGDQAEAEAARDSAKITFGVDMVELPAEKAEEPAPAPENAAPAK